MIFSVFTKHQAQACMVTVKGYPISLLVFWVLILFFFSYVLLSFDHKYNCIVSCYLHLLLLFLLQTSKVLYSSTSLKYWFKLSVEIISVDIFTDISTLRKWLYILLDFISCPCMKISVQRHINRYLKSGAVHEIKEL